ncbi:MAG: tetratricopeptide repeat protein [Candidatus Aminicenantes bacterium]|nr:tetratricopeptide repeat protein [Candidatus Aminicenantes bacterium]
MAKKILLVLLVIFFYGSYILYSQSAEDAIKTADRLMYLLNYTDAVRYYNQALENNLNIRGARVNLGYAYLRLKKQDEAIRILKEELALFPDNHEAYILLGYIYFKQDKFEEAKEVCEAYDKEFKTYLREKAYRMGFTVPLQVIDIRLPHILAEIKKENPNIGLPNFVLGLYHKNKLSFSKAENHFKLAHKWGHNPIECYLQLINIELIQKKWKDALNKTQEALRMKGPEPEFYFIMGYIYCQLEETENAISCYEQALEMKPYLIETMRNLSILYYDHQELEKASLLFEKYLRIKSYELYEKYDLKYSLSDLELSKDLIDQMDVEYIFPLKNGGEDSSKIINYRALSLVRSGRLKEAVQLLWDYLKIDDRSAKLNYNLGQLYNIFNKLDKALKYALRAVELDLNFKDAYDLIGNIYFKMRDYERSVVAYKEVIMIRPKDAMGYYNLGCVYHAAENFDEAENCWRNAIKYEKGIKKIKDRDKISEDELSVSLVVLKKPVSFRAHKSLGRLYLERNRPDKALDDFQRAIELEPSDPELYYELGKIYQAKSEHDKKYIEKAIYYYEKYIYFGKDKEQEVKELLKKLKKK